MREKKYNFSFFIFIILLLSLVSCGIEEYPYIDPIPQDGIIVVSNRRATVPIPNSYSQQPFSHFVIFYRIYVSDIDEGTPSTANFRFINPALSDDYNSFARYIGSETEVNINMDNLFTQRRYRYLALDLEDRDINSILAGDATGKILIFDFGSFKAPTMMVATDRNSDSGAVYTLKRSNGNGAFNPLPADRYFFNKEDLFRADNITDIVNADVVNKTGMDANSPRHTYAAFFIVAVGINNISLSYIYSTPAFIHAFQLPDQ